MVCEGPSDRAIIEAVLDHYLEDNVSVSIQPPTASLGGESGPFGGGWKGVRTWCQQETTGAGGIATVLANADLLVIQADADVVADPKISRQKPCPPPADNANEVRSLLLGWLGLQQVPDHVVLCVPAMASETWALVGLFPDDPSTTPCEPPPPDGVCVECRADVKAVLKKLGKRLRPKLVVSQGGRLKNQVEGYRNQQAKITRGWQRVMSICSEAIRFDADLQPHLPST